jgi:hypothetical protein
MNDAQWIRIADWQMKITPVLEARARELLDQLELQPPISQAEWAARVAEAEVAVSAAAMHDRGIKAHRDRRANAIAGIGPNGKPETFLELAQRLESTED